nr:heptaprenyl diphosphate synthase component 1 [Metabacillus litoralis]
MQDIDVQLAKIKEALEVKLTHPFLIKHLPSPKIDDDKLLLLYAIFDEIDLTMELKTNYILTAMLVQIALDTHDDVTTTNVINSDEFVQRQLTVLAGDYFSGLYYLLLSNIKDINMVRTLAIAIKEINEHKIRLYHDKEANEKQFLESVIVVETSLFQKITDHYKLDFLKLLTTKFLTYKRLSHEKFHTNFESKLSINNLTKTCNGLFEETVELINKGFYQNSMLRELLLKHLHPDHFQSSLHDNKIVEEG